MKQIQTPSKGRAAVAAALSLGLAFGSLSFGAMVFSPTEALAKPEDSGPAYSELPQSLTIEVKGVCEEVLASDTLSKAFTIKVENTDDKDSYPLEYDKENGVFKVSDIPAGDYRVIIESHSDDFRVIETDDGSDKEPVYNGYDILLDNDDDGLTVALLTLQSTNAGTYTPEAKPLETMVNNTPKAEDGIANKDSMPTGTTYTWETTPDTSAPGKVTGTVRVNYPHGCSETVEVPVTVTAPPNPDPNPDPEPETPDTPDKPDTPETPETPDTPDKPDTPETPETPDTPDKPDSPETPETPNNKTPDNPATPQDTDVDKDATQPAEQAKPAAPSDVKPKVKPQAQATPQTGDAAGILGTVASFFGAGALGVAAVLRRRR